MEKMDKKKFLRHLEIRTPDHLRGGVFSFYSGFIEKYGRDVFYPQDFHEAIIDMERIRTSLTPEEKPALHKKGISKKEISDFSKLSPQDIITSDFLLDKIEPWIEDLRKRIFKIPRSPFNWDEAVKWIEEEANKKYKAEKKEGDLFGKKNKKTQQRSIKILYFSFNPSAISALY